MTVTSGADVPIKKLMQITGCSRGKIDALVHNGKIMRVGNCISSMDAEKIIKEKEIYISFPDFAKAQSGERFNGRVSKDRDKMLDYLEEADFFGAEVIPANKLLVGDMKEHLYFFRQDIAIIEEGLKPFIKEFGMTEQEKVEQLLDQSDKAETVSMLRSYIDDPIQKVTITPAFTECVRQILNFEKEAYSLSDEEIVTLIKSTPCVTTQDYIIEFLNYQRNKLGPQKVKFREIRREKKRNPGAPAYDDETYLQLAECLFSPEYIYKNHMLEKALDNHKYAEMWLYLSLFFCCASRAADITRIWQYPGLLHRSEMFLGYRFCKETLRDDILMDRIPDEAYEIIAKFALGMVDANGQLPSKTSSNNPPVMSVLLSERLLSFFGLLTLIAEVHMLDTGIEGYMRENRTSTYQNKVNLRHFFGPRISEVLRGENIWATRLNKTLLQGVEHAGRKLGHGGLLTATIASYMRAHKDLDTIRFYLRDQKLTGETADVVLYNMLDRGVFGFQVYKTLLAAYPDAMRKLSMSEQSKVIKMIKAGPLEIEFSQTGILTQISIMENFESGDTSSALRMLNNMYEITQCRGSAKDTGAYCLLRASQEMCRHPNWESCIENGCGYLILTRYGIQPLVSVIKKYLKRAKAGDKKAKAVLEKVIVPRYKSVLNQFLNDSGIPRAERNGILKFIEEAKRDG